MREQDVMSSGIVKEKLKAAGLHLAINIIIFISLLILLRFLWFPSPYFTASGGMQGLKIVALVDVVLGPLLTFVIFNKNKASHLLKKDVSIILTLQILAFIWGIWTIYMQRPIAVTFWDDGFYTVSARSLSGQTDYRNKIDTLGDKLPVYAYVDRPLSGPKLDNLNNAIKEHDYIPPFQISSLYAPYKDNLETIFSKRFPQDQLLTFLQNQPKINQHVQELLLENNLSIDDAVPVQLLSKYHNMIILFKDNGEILGFIQSPKKNE